MQDKSVSIIFFCSLQAPVDPFKKTKYGTNIINSLWKKITSFMLRSEYGNFLYDTCHCSISLMWNRELLNVYKVHVFSSDKLNFNQWIHLSITTYLYFSNVFVSQIVGRPVIEIKCRPYYSIVWGKAIGRIYDYTEQFPISSIVLYCIVLYSLRQSDWQDIRLHRTFSHIIYCIVLNCTLV